MFWECSRMVNYLAYFFTKGARIILTEYPWKWWHTICNWLYLLRYLLERNFDFYVNWHRFNFFSLRNPLLNLWLFLKFKTNVCFFNDRDLTKKDLFFLCQHNTRIKRVSSSKNWRWNYLEWTKTKSQRLSVKNVFFLSFLCTVLWWPK